MLKDGTLGSPEDTGFPSIPGVTYTGLIDYFQELNFGNAFIPRDESGVVAPGEKVAGANFTVLAPKVDKDGNDIAGVRSTTIQAPLATYTGWNLRSADIGALMRAYGGGGHRAAGTCQVAHDTAEETLRALIAAMNRDDEARLDAIVAAYKRRFHQRSVGVIVQAACVSF